VETLLWNILYVLNLAHKPNCTTQINSLETNPRSALLPFYVSHLTRNGFETQIEHDCGRNYWVFWCFDLHPIISVNLKWDPNLAVQVFPFNPLKQAIMTIPNRLFQLQYYTNINKIVLSSITLTNRKIKEVFFLLLKLFKK